MGMFHKLCYFCQNKKGWLSIGYYCEITGEDLDEKSDLFKYGCDGGCSGYKYCPYYKENK